MRRADVGHDAYVRLGYVAQVRYFAGMVGTHLKHQELRVVRAIEDGHGQADVVVEVAFRGIRAPYSGEEGAKQFLRCGLAGRAGDAHDFRAKRAAALQGGAVKLLVAVDNPRRALRKSLRYVVVPVRFFAFERDERHSRLDGTGVESGLFQHTPRVELRKNPTKSLISSNCSMSFSTRSRACVRFRPDL